VNAGFAVAGEVDAVAVLNDDLVLEPGGLTELAAELDRRPNAAAAQGVVVELARPERVDGCGIGWNRDWQAVQIGQGETPPPRNAAPFEIFGVSATAALYRTTALRAVAGAAAPFFDPRLGSYYEDVELAVRLRDAGFESWCVPRARARHAGQATARRAPAERWRLIYRNRRWVAAALLGDQFERERGRIVRRDRRDFVRRLLSFDFAGARGLAAGLSEARRGTPLSTADRSRALAAAERLAVSSTA
jgi:GT2 family glycosyltransferase